MSVEDPSFYRLFLDRMEAITARSPLGVDALLKKIDVSKSQLTTWLKRGVEEGHLEKLNRPVRYRRQDLEPKQASMFDES